MPSVDLTAEWVPVRAEPGVDVPIPVTVPAGYETGGTWTAVLYPESSATPVATFTVTTVGQVVTLSLTGAQTGPLVPSGTHRFDGFWILSRSVAGQVDWWIKGPLTLCRGRLPDAGLALDLTAEWVPVGVEPGADLVLPVTVPAGLETGTWTATVYPDDRTTTAVETLDVGVAGQVITLSMSDTDTAGLVAPGGSWFTGFWVLRRVAPGGAIDWWMKGSFTVGRGQQMPADGAQALAVTVSTTTIDVTVNVPQALTVTLSEPVIEITSTSVSGVTPTDLAAAIEAHRVDTTDVHGIPDTADTRTYLHTQAIPATVWPVPHGLNRRPVVDLITTAGDEFVGGIHHVDANNLTVTLLTAQNGYAVCR